MADYFELAADADEGAEAAIEAALESGSKTRTKGGRTAKAKPSCKAKAVDLLARSDQSIRKLKEKLRRKEYSEEEIAATIAWLKEKHFIQEEAGCQRRFQYLYEDSTNSVRQILVKLQQQGYEREMIRACIPDDISEREYQKAMKVLRMRFKPGADGGKMYNHLYMKGFDYEAARNAVEDTQFKWEETAADEL